jgi:hypothetical protein
MAHLQALDQGGDPMPLVDFSGQLISFGQNVGPDAQGLLWKLLDRLVQNGALVQADLDEMLAGLDFGGYSIAIVAD